MLAVLGRLATLAALASPGSATPITVYQPKTIGSPTLPATRTNLTRWVAPRVRKRKPNRRHPLHRCLLITPTTMKTNLFPRQRFLGQGGWSRLHRHHSEGHRPHSSSPRPSAS